jgi:hypothetical protein
VESPQVSEARDAQPARLSAEQKRDLAGQALAAVLTTAMMMASFGLLTRDVPLPAIAAVAGGVPAVGAVGTPVAIPTPPQAPRPAARRSIRLENVDARAQVNEVAPATSTAAAESGKRGRDRGRFARRLAGLLTGDGSYAVRPFPSVSTER